MSSPNRVTPRSEIRAIPLRGMFMGNRGCLHLGRSIVRPYAGRRWIVCETSVGDRHVEQWREGRYTVLFFYDEALAFAAGHRPCAECRRERYEAYRVAWSAAFGELPSADTIDRRLHAERLDGRVQRTHEADWATLPRGAFALVDGVPVVVLGPAVAPWSEVGYGPAVSRPASGRATVLTPPATLGVLAAGYVPVIADVPSRAAVRD